MARATLDRRIGQDHYDLPAILERLLLTASAGEIESAKSDADVFKRLGFSRETNRILSLVASGDLRVVAYNRIYVSGATADVDPLSVARVLEAAMAELAAYLKIDSKPVWVDFCDGAPYANVTRLEFSGLARISLSRELLRMPDWSSILWHEAAHATVLGRSRFLDEGWAVRCQFHYAPDTLFPVECREYNRFVLAPEVAAMPLAKLLDYAGRDITFSDLVATEHAWRSIYVRASRLVEALLERIGPHGMLQVFERTAEGEAAVTVLEETCGCAVGEIEAACPLGHKPAAPREDLAQVRKYLADARLGRDRGTFEAELISLRSAPYADAAHLRLLGLMLSEATMAAARDGRTPDKILLTDLDGVIVALDRASDAAGAELCRAQKTVVALLGAANPIGKATRSQAAARHYEQAKSLAPDDAEIALAFARYELGKPVPFRSIDHAVELLRQAEKDPVCRDEAVALIDAHRLRAKVGEPVKDAGTPIAAPPITVTGVAVRVAQLHVVTDQGFALNIAGLDVACGRCLAIIGGNGAGKTTLLESLVGLRTAKRADVSIAGSPLAEWCQGAALRRRCGVQMQRASFAPDMCVAEIVRLREKAYGPAKASIHDLAIGELFKSRYGKLSRGQRQRVDLYVALAHEPEIAILDEPSAGLDAHYQGVLARLLKGRGERTVLIATHDRKDLDVATDILWLQGGKLVRHGEAGTVLRHTLGRFRAEATFADRSKAESWLAEMQRCAPLLHQAVLDDGSVVMFADVPLEPLLRHGLADAESYSFGKVTMADLAGVASRETIHA